MTKGTLNIRKRQRTDLGASWCPRHTCARAHTHIRTHTHSGTHLLYTHQGQCFYSDIASPYSSEGTELIIWAGSGGNFIRPVSLSFVTTLFLHSPLDAAHGDSLVRLLRAALCRRTGSLHFHSFHTDRQQILFHA